AMTDKTISPRGYRGASLEQRRAQRRQCVVDAAMEVYGGVGYRHGGVGRGGEAAGLTQRSFDECCSHSDELLVACGDEATPRLREHNVAAAEAAGSDPVRRSRAMLDAYFQLLKDEPHMARLLLVEIRGISPAVDRAIEAALRASTADMT